MAEKNNIDAEAMILSKLASNGIAQIEANPSREVYATAGNAFRQQLQILEKDPALLKQVTEKLAHSNAQSSPDFKVVLDKDKNVTGVLACESAEQKTCIGSVVLPPKQREISDKLAAAIAGNNQEEAGRQASALHKEVIRSYETKDVYTIGNLDQETDARRMRMTDIARHRINPEIAAKGSQRSIAFYPPDTFAIGGFPYFASVGDRQTKKFEYMIKKDGSIPWNLPVIGPRYGNNEDPGRP